MLCAAAVDLILLPQSPATWPYAAPVLLAAAWLRPRRIAALGSLAFVAYVVAGALSARPWLLTLSFGTGLLVLLALAVALSALRHTAHSRALRAEAAERRAQEVQEELRNVAARTRDLADASVAFASATTELEPLLEVIARSAVRHPEEGCALFLRDVPQDPDGSEDDVQTAQDLRLVAAFHRDRQHLEFMRQALGARHLRIGEGISGQVVARGETVLMSDISAAELAASLATAHQALPSRLGVRTALGVPLKAREHVIGALTVWRDASAPPLTEDDTGYLQDLAVRASLAVSNARLYEREREAVRVRDTFLAVAAHELRTPLTSLSGYAQMLVRSLRRGPAHSPAAPIPSTPPAELAERVVQQVDRLTRMMTELLDVSRIDSGKFALHPEPLDLAALARGIVDVVQERESPTARLVVDGTASLTIRADRTRLEQVLLNLLINAVKFSDGGAEIRISLERAGDGARLTVRDHGIGIPPDQRETLFRRFRQAHGGRGGGLGLGLYVCKQIVERHGGRIWAEYPADGGTRFVVELPAETSSVTPAE